MENILQSSAICPKCKSDNLILEEVWHGHSIQWEQLAGKFDKNDGSLNEGYPNHLNGICKECNHVWKFKKYQSISDVAIDALPEKAITDEDIEDQIDYTFPVESDNSHIRDRQIMRNTIQWYRDKLTTP